MQRSKTMMEEVFRGMEVGLNLSCEEFIQEVVDSRNFRNGGVPNSMMPKSTMKRYTCDDVNEGEECVNR